ncbi:hypothetical protein [Lysinibacter cavernae]|uniref:Uncharacterized protein n=1 Tax=Lysinibacter cavernae TaxID=1640652 RepID=A0A7X5R3F3_9MICO|nr:hypothetical protein [Lysinibacter cavernae]NIH54919.1 hypothetical protein [Lysinibacter cavernae]
MTLFQLLVFCVAAAFGLSGAMGLVFRKRIRLRLLRRYRTASERNVELGLPPIEDHEVPGVFTICLLSVFGLAMCGVSIWVGPGS